MYQTEKYAEVMCPENLSTLSLYLNPFEQTSQPILIDQRWFFYSPVEHDHCLNTSKNLIGGALPNDDFYYE